MTSQGFEHPGGYFDHADHSHHTSLVYCLRCGQIMEEKLLPSDDRPRHCCAACGFVFYQNPKVVVATILDWDGDVVLVRRGIEPRKGTWTYPGGFLELGESLEEGALRETREETSLEIQLTSLLNVYSRPIAGIVVVVYTGRVICGSPAPCEEVSEIGRFPLSAIPWADLAFPTTEWALRDYLARQPSGSNTS